jgi:hypothetical protein
MTELELQLRELGAGLDFPATPDLARSVRARLAERRSWWRGPSRRRALAVALAILVVAAAAVMAVPSARTAILRFFHIGAVTVERVETLPPARERPLTTGLGRPLPPEVAARRAGFTMLLPPLDEPPERVYVRAGVLQATLLDVPDVGTVLLTEMRGGNQMGLAKKIVDRQTNVTSVSVNGSFGIWITGAPHVFLFEDQTGRVQEVTTRLAGNVLVWEQDGLTLRLEGELTKARALELARSIR